MLLMMISAPHPANCRIKILLFALESQNLTMTGRVVSLQRVFGAHRREWDIFRAKARSRTIRFNDFAAISSRDWCIFAIDEDWHCKRGNVVNCSLESKNQQTYEENNDETSCKDVPINKLPEIKDEKINQTVSAHKLMNTYSIYSIDVEKYTKRYSLDSNATSWAWRE